MLKLAVVPFLFATLLPQQAPKAPVKKPAKPIEFKKSVLPLVKKYCVSCHSGEHPADGIDLSKFKTQADVDAQLRVWRKAGREVQAGHMPPATAKPLPSAKDKKTFVDYCSQLPQPR